MSVSSIKRVNQPVEKGWMGDCCCCSGLSSYKQMPVSRVKMGYLPPSITGCGCLCQVPLVLGREGEGKITCVSGNCQNHACLSLENQNPTYFSHASHDMPLSLSLFLKNCKASMKFVYFFAYDKKCKVSQFVCVLHCTDQHVQ